MRRRRALAIAASVLAAPGLALAQAKRVPVLGLLWIRSDETEVHLRSLDDGLRKRGYVAGRNIAIDSGSLVDAYEALPAAAERLVRDKVDIIVVYGSTAARAASRATAQIPIVSVSAGDPVATGLATSLARPGGNVTGLTSTAYRADGKRFQILREVVPSMRAMAVVLYPESPSEAESLRNYQSFARPAGIEVRPVEVRTVADIDVVVPAIRKLDVQAVVVVAGSMFSTHPKRLVAAVNTLRLPALYSNQTIADAGGLIVYAADVLDNFEGVAVYIDKILKGAKPGDLAMDEVRKWTFVVNRRAARDLGITLPASVLAGAEIR